MKVQTLRQKPLSLPLKAVHHLGDHEFKHLLKTKSLLKNENPTPTLFERLKENSSSLNPAVSAHEKDVPDINRLITKLSVLGPKKLCGKFLISGGLFDQAQFYFSITNNKLTLNVHRASLHAQEFLKKHQATLWSRLMFHEINLTHLRFTS